MTDGEWHHLDSPRINAERARIAASQWAIAHGLKAITRRSGDTLWVRFTPRPVKS